MSAIDNDSSSVVTYRLNGDLEDTCWSMDSTTGVLSLTCDLKIYFPNVRQITKTYNMNITATDGFHKSDPTKITIKILNDDKKGNKLVDIQCKETDVRTQAEEILAAAAKINTAEEHYALLPLRYGLNTHAPEISHNIPKVLSVREDATTHSEVLKIKASDHDQGYNGRMVYALSGGQEAFRIGVKSGILETWGSLDRESVSEYILNITVYDLGVPHRSASQNITIQILDVNDNAPQFSQVSYSLHLPENTRNGTSVAHLQATDADEGVNAQVRYELVTHVKAFTIDPLTGIVYVSATLDREHLSEYDIRVLARDGAPENSLYSMAQILITIIDINDCAPDFGAAQEINVGIPEDLPLGAIVATVTATDKDMGGGGRITYSLIEDNVPFRIDTQTGIVRLSQLLDYESRSSYNITVIARDGGRPALQSQASLIVDIHDVDENIGAPIFPERLLRAGVQENQPPGTLVTKLAAEDPGGESLTYTITSGSGVGYFTIDDEGSLRTLVSLDRESSRGYWVTIVVTDAATVPLSDSAHMWVEVEDVNDHLPQTLDPAYRVFVAENAELGTTITTLQATDGDVSTSNISFTITGGNDEEHFSIDQLKGTLSVSGPLDRETTAEYKLSVTVSDGQLTSVTPVTVTITDVNDHRPHFLESLYRITIPARSRTNRRDPLFMEDEESEYNEAERGISDASRELGEWLSFTTEQITDLDEPLFWVFAVDDDIGPNALLEYSIKSNRGKRFKINSKTGQVYTNREFKPGDTYDLMIEARDGGLPSLSGTTRVILRVAEVPLSSAHAPVIQPSSLSSQVMEMDPPGQLVAFIHATDEDNDTLWYYITGGDVRGHFSIGVHTGIVSLARQLDHENQFRYTLQLSVTDGVLTTSDQLVIDVLDANDQYPVLSQAMYDASIEETAPVGTTVLALQCRDIDANSRLSPVYFTMHHSEALHSDGLFALDSATGEIMVARPLDRELSVEHQLTVSCHDRGRREHSDYSRVNIKVMDSNDHAPVFLEHEINSKVNMGASVGTVISKVTAFDRDKGNNGRISYSISEGNRHGVFTIDESLGSIYLSQPLSQESSLEYMLLVRAYDHGKPTRDATLPVKIVISSIDVPPSWDSMDLPDIIEVSEWASIGTAVAHVGVTNPISVAYKITGGNPQAKFRVSPASGIVSLVGALDHEEIAWYNITITATNTAGVFRSRWLGIRVLDENDWWPEWDEMDYVGVLLQDSIVGAPVYDVKSPVESPMPLTVTATDRDQQGQNGRVTYSIMEKNATKYFSLDPHTGAVRVSGSLDELAGDVASFSVWATDGGHPTRECQAPVNVRIKVESTYKTKVFFAHDEYKAILYKPTLPGVRVLCVDITTNAQRGPSYTIMNGDPDKAFSFDETSMCLIVQNHLNLRPSYNLTLKASVGSTLANTTLIILIRSVPYTSLAFTEDKYFANVLENSTKELNVAVIRIKSPHLNQNINYTIMNPNEHFEIKSSAGVIKTTGKPFDRETKDHFALMVQAQDLEELENIAFVEVNVVVLDVNDNAPVFVNQPLQALVSTSSKRGTIVTKVRSIDGDAGDFGAVKYELIRGSSELFSIGKETGEISLKQMLILADKTYSITVEASDGGKPPLKSQAQLIVKVVSAEGPMFSSAVYEATVPEDVVLGTAVVRVEAQNPSGTPLIFTIAEGNVDEEFSLDYKTGLGHPENECIICTQALLDYESIPSHNMTIRARDPLTGLYTDVVVTVALKDVNDNSPEFGKDVIHAQVSEAMNVGHVLLQVIATDRDTGLGGEVRYSCSEGCDYFTVIPDDGSIVLKAQLDAELRNEHRIIVTAWDLGLPPKSASTTVIVQVTDSNDNPPVWDAEVYKCRVSAEAIPGHIITSLRAHDADINQSQPLQYRIHAGDRYNIFHLGGTTGLLSVTAPHRLHGSVNLNISASDGVHIAFTQVQAQFITSNLHAPRFRTPLFEGSLEENLKPGHLVLTLEAEDLDNNDLNFLRYEILYQSQEGAFKVDKYGRLYSDKKLDREQLDLHVLYVSVTDKGGHSDFAKVQISIEDLNDNAPEYAMSSYQGNINVEFSKGVTFLQVQAIDKDFGRNGQVIYKIYEPSNSQVTQMFSVHPEAGNVSLIVDPNGRANEVFQFFIRAEDRGIPRRTSDVPVTIYLLPKDEHPPKFSSPYLQFFQREDAPIGSVITSFMNGDKSKVQYEIISQVYDKENVNMKSLPLNENSKPFALRHSGLFTEVILQNPLNRENHRLKQIIITNQTMTTPPILDYLSISVIVMDVNDCAPQFSSEVYEAMITENNKIEATVTVLTATDEDEGNNGEVHYSILDSEDLEVMSNFRIDPYSGAVVLTSTLDRELRSQYSFTIQAADRGVPQLSSTARVIVHVKDVNDNPPIFTQESYVTAVLEDAEIDTVIIGLQVTDADQSIMELDYFVTAGDHEGLFMVYASGEVYVAHSLDREKQEEYVLTITATDGKFTANTTVFVTVLDVNDNGPECKDYIYHKEISEGASLGTYVASIESWDSDVGLAARSRYSLTGEGAEDFAIEHLSGQVTTAAQLDREHQNRYSLLAVVEDWDYPELQCQVKMIIDIGDINDNAPQFSMNNYVTTVSEDAPINSVVFKMAATDPDLGFSRKIRYSMVDSADDHFTIDNTEGIVMLSKSLDREIKNTYSITVQATDQGSPPLASTAVLTISVSDINDNPPEFVQTVQQTSVPENIEVDTEVMRVMATSKDIGINAEITYSINHSTEEAFLKIHPKTGVIRIGSSLDYEKVQQVITTVIATDGGDPPLSSTAIVNVTVTDVNDNTPVFSQQSYYTKVNENARPRITIIQVSATDVDSNDNGKLNYVLKPGQSHLPFQVDKYTGVLTLLEGLDREKVNKYEAVVEARDLGLPSNTATTTINIVVEDVNDNPPEFTNSNYSVVVQENRPVGYSVMHLLATDADVDPNGAPFTWELLNHASSDTHFTIGQDAIIRLATNRLNHLIQNKYNLEVRVWDSGSPPLHASTIVEVTVVEESRYPPTIYPLLASVANFKLPYPGGVVGKIISLDQDPYDTLEYSVHYDKGANVMKYFDIDGQDGTLVAISPLDEGKYKVNVSVYDGSFTTIGMAYIHVNIITEDMLESSVIVQIGPVLPDEFLTQRQKEFVRAIAFELALKEDSLKILSIQPTISMPRPNSRSKRDVLTSLDVLIAVEKNMHSYLTRDQLKVELNLKQNQIRKRLKMPLFNIMESACNMTDCSENGLCIDIVEIDDSQSEHIKAKSSSLVAPKFSQRTICQCHQGLGGHKCEEVLNACGHRPCASYEECTPTDSNSKGFTCQCQENTGGPQCSVDLSHCQKTACPYYPHRPLSFKGKSYAQYNVPRHSQSTSFSLTVYMRTMYPVGTIMFSSGNVDYSILEVANGHVQYRWDCGSGEGLVRISAIQVNDGIWHFINLTREGTISRLTVDNEGSSGVAPGVHDSLNLNSDFMFIGAKVEKDHSPGRQTHISSSLGFVGCMDKVNIDGRELPLAMSGSANTGATMKRLANVELQCPTRLDVPGICGSYPCLNGGACSEPKIGTFHCSCHPRFTGSQCHVDTAPCSSSPCLNGGKCIVVGHSYKCKCPNKLSGQRCEYGVHCNPNPCQNGGRCEEGQRAPICKCQQFSGPTCDEDIDECAHHNPCQNSGTCLNFYGGFKCICHGNVTGEYCTEAVHKHNKQQTSLNITLENLICILAVFLAALVAVLVLIAWHRRRWKHKQLQQNNISNSEMHVKNDLKADDSPKRNSKICNVQADQVPPLPPRPASYTPSTDSALFHTLKQLADLSAQANDNIELTALTRKLGETDVGQKPWYHHNNLNESYFTPVKDIGCSIASNLDNTDQQECTESPGAPSTPYSEQSTVSLETGSPPAIPPLPLHILKNRNKGKSSLEERLTHHSGRENIVIKGDLALGEHSLSQEKNKGWNKYNNCNSTAVHDNRERRDTDKNIMDKQPILNRLSNPPDVIMNVATPLLISDARDDIMTIVDEEEDDEDEDDPCSFEEILLANNISLGTNSDNDTMKYNIVSDLDDECPDYETMKISNVPVEKEDCNKFGSPRSRRPFQRSDYSRVSDVSFLSTPEDESVKDSFSDIHESDDDSSENKLENRRMIQASHSEVYL
ncbi:unnamed protein product [Meganyctiphanes norvegica]|uniref:Uncharacterized protein n=1 Tax=Meganyctiphanes norvegica TaxID=48144 RepID=A0AAV2S140_MEGNR